MGEILKSPPVSSSSDPVFLALLQYLIETSFKKGLGYPLNSGLAVLFLYALRGDIRGLEALCCMKKDDDPVSATKILAVGGKLIYLGQKFRAVGIKWKGVLVGGRKDGGEISSDPCPALGFRGGEAPAMDQSMQNRGSMILLGLLLTGCLFAFSIAKEEAAKLGTVIGIDLGTTYSCVGVYKNGQVKIRDGEVKVFSPEEISAMILTKMKETAEAFLGKKIKDAVVTVPAYFSVAQRRATKDACDKARLNLVTMINEPTAAAIAYGRYKQDGQKNILVYHIGGGTLDASILIIENGAFVVLATRGNKLGGEDFDKTVMQHFIKLINEKHRKDISWDDQALAKLRRECERAKRALGSQQEVQMEIESLCEGLFVLET